MRLSTSVGLSMHKAKETIRSSVISVWMKLTVLIASLVIGVIARESLLEIVPTSRQPSNGGVDAGERQHETIE
jgi:hypothetical protein